MCNNGVPERVSSVPFRHCIRSAPCKRKEHRIFLEVQLVA